MVYLANIISVTMLELITCVISVMGLALATCCRTYPHSSRFWWWGCLRTPQAWATVQIELKCLISAPINSYNWTVQRSLLIYTKIPNSSSVRNLLSSWICRFLTSNSLVPSQIRPRGEHTTIVLDTGKQFKIETVMLKHALNILLPSIEPLNRGRNPDLVL